MKIDMHVHLADINGMFDRGGGEKNRNQNLYLSRMLKKVLANLRKEDADESLSYNKLWQKKLNKWVRESQLDKAVLLALDMVYDESGKQRPDQTILHVRNDYILSAVEDTPEFIFGASIHPYRKDAVKELERLVGKGAVLVKWIPSSQRIKPDDPLCFEFYEALAHYKIPLLSHTGMEHTLGSRRMSYNYPTKLIPALERGVKVIAAHCGVHMFLHEPSFFKSWCRMAKDYQNFYGDSGAFSVVTRIPALKRILKDKELRKKLLYGSDFPGIPAPKWCWQLGFRKMRELGKIENQIERNLRVMQAFDMTSEIVERAEELLPG